jgi:hydrogenase maturation protease
LGLGNEIIADDAIGILAAQALKSQLGDEVDVIESSVAGMALMEIMMDYDKAILIDAIVTGDNPPGSILEMKPEQLGHVIAPSAHYAGIPEVIALAHQMQIHFPDEIAIFAVEVKDALTIGGEISTEVRQALPALCAKVQEQIQRWKSEPGAE